MGQTLEDESLGLLAFWFLILFKLTLNEAPRGRPQRQPAAPGERSDQVEWGNDPASEE